jgi:hypothetical protein
LGRMGPYGIWIAIVVISMFLTVFRGCGSVGNQPSPPVQNEQSEKGSNS